MRWSIRLLHLDGLLFFIRFGLIFWLDLALMLFGFGAPSTDALGIMIVALQKLID